MPLETRVVRDGELVKGIWNYGYFTLSCMYTAAIKDSCPEYEYAPGQSFGALADGQFVDFSMAPIYYLDIPKCPLVKKGVQTLKRTYSFPYNDDFTLIFEAGDILKAWRSSK